MTREQLQELLLKTLSAMLVIPSGIITEVKELFLKAKSPIEVTLSGIITEVKELL